MSNSSYENVKHVAVSTGLQERTLILKGGGNSNDVHDI